MTRERASAFWRRLDTPGHDTCSLEETATGWKLDGAAVFRQDDVSVRLDYRVTCDSAWRTEQGQVKGWWGHQAVQFVIEHRGEGEWTLNGAVVRGLQSCVDLDFSFTPATNLLQLRRLALNNGQALEVPVAWFDVATGALAVLSQRYERRSETTYWYQAPSVNYEGLLEVDSTGFVRHYPGLWSAERS